MLARLHLELGDLGQAESWGRAAVDRVAGQKLHLLDEELTAGAALTRVLLAQGRIVEAVELFGEAAEKARRSQRPAVRLEVGLVSGYLLWRAGDTDAARRRLEEVLAAAKDLGISALELEAGLALGELAATSDNAADRKPGFEELEAVRRRSRDKGFGLFARRAESAARKASGAPAAAAAAAVSRAVPEVPLFRAAIPRCPTRSSPLAALGIPASGRTGSGGLRFPGRAAYG